MGGKLGTVIAVEPRPRATIYTIAFTEGFPQKFISPPIMIQKVYSPMEFLKSRNFDSPINFDLHFGVNRLSLAYEYDHLLSFSFTRTNLKPYQIAAVYKVLNSYKQRFLIADWASATSLLQLSIACRFLISAYYMTQQRRHSVQPLRAV
jgi:hypothetical protein